MDMQNACREIITEVDGSLGCIVIDTQTGLTVAAASRPGAALNTTMMDLLSIIGTNMFCGQMIRRFEEALDRTKSSGVSFVREVQMTTAQTNQFMSAIPGWSGGLLVLITDKSVSLGLGWMAVHRVVKHLGAPSAAPSPAADAPAPTAAPPLGSAVRTEPSPAALASQPQHQPITAPLPSVAETRTPYQAPAAQAQHQRPEEDAGPQSPLAASHSASPSPSPSASHLAVPAAAQSQPLPPAAAERPTSTAAQQPEAPSSPKPAVEVEDEEQPKALSAKATTAADAKTPKKAASRAVGPRMNMFSSRQHKKRGAKK